MTRFMILVLALMAATLLGACGSGNPDQPAGAALEDLWPHEDGNFWRYEACRIAEDLEEEQDIEELVGPLFDSEAEVPPFPSMDELWEAYTNLCEPDWPLEWQGSYHLRFDGEEELFRGDFYQVLTDSTHWDIEPRAFTPSSVKVHVTDGFRSADAPNLLCGMFWRVTEEAIEGVTDEFFVVEWKWLEADYAIGREFDFISWGDITLHSRVTDIDKYWTGSEWLEDVVQVFYVLEPGVAFVTILEDPDPIGYFRPLDFGVVYFAPDVGPVYCHVRSMVNAADPEFEGLDVFEVLLNASGH